MKNAQQLFQINDKSVAYCVRSILTGSVMVCSGLPTVFAAPPLPISVNAGQLTGSTIPELTSPNLHAGIDVGHASATYSANGHKLTIHQSTAKSVMDWDSFNIAVGHSVEYVQPDSNSVALNTIHQVDASKILGNLSANGQVYLVNANGFVFGKNAVVNTNSLVATNLSISDTAFDKGLTNVIDSTANANSLEPVAALSGDGSVYRDTGHGSLEKIKILVEKGANITTAKGGRVILAAPEVENDGNIAAQDGQAILVAATDKVYLQESDAEDLRGLLVEVHTGGQVKNLGKILTERGNTTLMGFAVSQQGIASASTSVVLNGSVHLLAREGAKLVNVENSYRLEPVSTRRGQDSGDNLGTQATVTMAGGSTTSVGLDASAGSAVRAQAQPQSIVDIQAGRIHMQANAAIVAHGGQVKLTASASPSDAMLAGSVGYQSRISLDKGSRIDVSGLKNVAMDMSDNILDVELRNFELRDSPIQKTGLLHGKTIKVDMRKGTQLADISGSAEKIQQSIAERTTAAGKVNLQSEGDVLVSKGASIDISGGSLHYKSGKISTSQLLSNGVLYDVSKADPNRSYQKLVTSTYFQSGYYQGGNAGAVNIKASALILDGNLDGQVSNGLYQRSSNSAVAGQLNIDTVWSKQSQQDVIFNKQQAYTLSPDDQPIQSPLYLSNSLFGKGLNHLSVNTGGKLLITDKTKLKLPALGSLSLSAGEIENWGSIIAPAGTVTLKTEIGGDPGQVLDGHIGISKDSSIDTSGLWINDTKENLGAANPKLLAINGGDINLQAQGDLSLPLGSRLLANAGANFDSHFKLSAGTGGNISINSTGLTPSHLLFDPQLSAYGLAAGGSLSIIANDIAIAGSGPKPNNNTLYLSASLFETGGFSRYAVTANAGDIEVSSGTQLKLQQHNWQLNSQAYAAASGSSLGRLVSQTVLPDALRKPVDLTFNLAHNASIAGGYVPERQISIAKDSSITADPNANININSDANIFIDGMLSAPAGTIDVTINTPPAAIDKGYSANQAILLGANAQLRATGATINSPNPKGLVLGDVKSGGQIKLTANRGYIVTDSNSVIDVSGTSAKLDIVNNQGITRQNIVGSAGAIQLSAAEGLILQGKFSAKAGAGKTLAGGAGAGGSLSLELNSQHRAEPEDVIFTNSDRSIHVSAETKNLLTVAPDAQTTIPNSLNGQAYISNQQIAEGGFDNLKLASSVIEPATYSTSPIQPERGEIRFDGNINLNLNQNLELDAPLISHSLETPALVNLTSNTMTLGSSWNRAAHGNLQAPLFGEKSTLTVNANIIDLRGSTEINGFAKTQMLSTGDLRLRGGNPNGEADLLGGLSLVGDLDLGAREIYPTTYSQFNLTVDTSLSPESSINILPAKSEAYIPLSAAGQLNLSAAHINNQGRLIAPFGQINLSAGQSISLTKDSSVSVGANPDTVIPFGRTEGELDWIYPLGLYSNIQAGTPQKAITLKSPSIDLAEGAKLNLNGGGNLSAFEFIAGPGGSVDNLAATTSGNQQAYAILPSLKSDYAPYDSLEFPSSGLSLGDSIHLSAANGLAAGNYVLLPAHYALLPGAYLITPQANTTDMGPGSTALRSDAATIVAGYRYSAWSLVADSRWSGYAVEPGAFARSRSEYQEYTAGNFFNARGGLPADAGTLSLFASEDLNLAATITAKASADGLGGMLDISADHLSIVNQIVGNKPSGTVVLLAGQLNNLGVDSILLGGRRTRNAQDAQLKVGAQSIVLAADSHLQAPEILLAASDKISLETNSGISAVGSLGKSDRNLAVSNLDGSTDGALLRVSNAAQVTVLRDSSGLTRQTGSLDINPNVLLSSSGKSASILLDASKDSRFLGNISMHQGDLLLSSSLISLGGGVPAGGLQLSESSLNNLQVDNLTLNSYSTLAIAGDLNLNLSKLSINAAGITGFGSLGQLASINADSISLQNPQNAKLELAGSGQGNIALQANTIELGMGEYSLTGFTAAGLTAASKVNNSGTSSISAAMDVTLDTPIWTASSGADTTLSLGAHKLSTFANSTAPANNNLGAKLTVTAANIDHHGHIGLAAGQVSFIAEQDLSMSAGSSIDTSGRMISLVDQQVYADAGAINLRANTGNLDIAENAQLDISGTNLGGAAGRLALSAGQGHLNLSGTIIGQTVQGADGGSLSVDSLTHSWRNFSDLNHIINSSGLTGDISIRQRAGDVLLAGADRLSAKNITISADTGSLILDGQLDVSGKQAGSLQLAAGDTLAIGPGAVINAASSLGSNNGGTVLLTSIDADLDGKQGISIAQGASIDVSGAATGAGGMVNLMANQIGTDDAYVAIGSDTVHGARQQLVTVLERVLDMPLSNANISQWHTDLQGFMDAAAQNSNLQNRLAGFSLRPGLDSQSSTSTNFDLADSLRNITWTQLPSSGQIWKTTLTDIAGALSSLQQINPAGLIRTYKEATSSALSADGTYYFDKDPSSPTFRQLFVRIFANTGATVAARYNPKLIKGDLLEHNGWDFEFPNLAGESWRFGEAQIPGLLSIRSSGDIAINQSISDGFRLENAKAIADLLGVNPANWLPTQILQTDSSWDYNIISGADLQAADLSTTLPTSASGNLTLASNSTVRTGTGSIRMAASGDITLTDQTASIYTAGRAASTKRYGSLDNSFVATTGFLVEYPFDGGDINLAAGKNILGAASTQLMSDWLQRTGSWNASDGIDDKDRPTAWGINFDGLVVANSANSKIQNLKFGFRENIGALGGGNINIHAGQNIRDLSVLLPSSAKPVGQVDADGLITENSWQQQGGGALTVRADGNIAGGVFYVDKGTADIKAGAAITGGEQYSSGSLFAMGDAQFTVSAANGIAIGTVFNPFVLTEPKFLDKTSYFSTYTANSGISLKTLAGDIAFNNNASLIQQQYKIVDQNSPRGRTILSSASFPLLSLYPGNLNATAYTGGLQIQNNLSLFPAANSSLNLLAAGDISIGNSENGVTVNQLDIDPALLLSPANPNPTINSATKYLFTTPFGGDTTTVHADVPVHKNDTGSNQIVSGRGSIIGIGNALVAMSKASGFTAGLDMANLSLQLQNLNPTDSSSIKLGGALSYPLQRDPLTGAIEGASGGIQLAGPGLLDVRAGGNIDLGSSDGITTIGNLLNPALPDTGADIQILAGNTAGDNTKSMDDFFKHYLDMSAYAAKKVDLQSQTTQVGRMQIALSILFDEIRTATKIAATSQGAIRQAAYQRGYDAIQRLFPDSQKADIKLFFSRIQTLEGGDINLMAPGGSVNVGLASAFSGLKSQADLGIVAQRQGDINILVKDDLQVNQSRVFTLDSGDITVWASTGNIDAGRGAKSSLATQKPKVSVDANGNISVEFPASISGSGIRAQSGYNNDHVGSVSLAAPTGVIDAGEAGIGGRNITIAATAIIGASNIQALGASFGIPSAAAPFNLPAGIGNATTALSKSVSDAGLTGQNDPDPGNANKKLIKVALIDAQIIGFGQCSVADVKANKPGCGDR